MRKSNSKFPVFKLDDSIKHTKSLSLSTVIPSLVFEALAKHISNIVSIRQEFWACENWCVGERHISALHIECYACDMLISSSADATTCAQLENRAIFKSPCFCKYLQNTLNVRASSRFASHWYLYWMNSYENKFESSQSCCGLSTR
jgi:hypothetical protein